MQGRFRKATGVEGGCGLDSYGLKVIARISRSHRMSCETTTTESVSHVRQTRLLDDCFIGGYL